MTDEGMATTNTATNKNKQGPIRESLKNMVKNNSATSAQCLQLASSLHRVPAVLISSVADQTTEDNQSVMQSLSEYKGFLAIILGRSPKK